MDTALRRHLLARLRPGSKAEPDGCAAADPDARRVLARWLDAGHPLVVRRPVRDQDGRLCLGLPLPPDQGKARLGWLAEPDTLERTEPPPLLSDCLDAAPPAWRAPLGLLDQGLRGLGLEPRVFGALAWARITGLGYLTPESDVDLLVDRDGLHSPDSLGKALDDWQAAYGRPPLDVEILLPDGSGFSWKEYASGSGRVLVKGNQDVRLVDRRALFPAPA